MSSQPLCRILRWIYAAQMHTEHSPAGANMNAFRKKEQNAKSTSAMKGTVNLVSKWHCNLLPISCASGKDDCLQIAGGVA